MKVSGIVTVTGLTLVLAMALPAGAQQEQKNDKQDHQQQDRREQGNPVPKPVQPNDQQHDRQPQQQQNDQQHARRQQGQNENDRQHAQQQQSRNQQPRRTQDQQREQHTAWQQHRAQSWQSDHRTWQQRGGYNGYRIPNNRYRGYFGSSHVFRISGRPFEVVGGF